MECSIRKASLEDALTITKLLDEVTLALHQKGIAQWDEPWDQALLEQEIRLGRVWAVCDGAAMIGTFSLRPLTAAPWLSSSADPEGQWYLYRVALLPSCQGRGVGRNMVCFALDLARRAQKDLYLDCWAGNAVLRQFYSSAGFDTIGIFPEEDYEICVFFHRFDKEN
ncbi:MAG: GNAT family N-acetyltransferase [Oscillospiraceae bacterium]|nr:GNAT family N-acetyltransferase [Oscillospiraceae bacterium]